MKIVIVGCGRVGGALAETYDRNGHQVMLFPSEHLLAYCIKSNPSVEFRPMPPDEAPNAKGN